MSTRYQLVLQFPEWFINLDSLVALEDELIASLDDADVDGHDVGSGEANIFLFTESPQRTFSVIRDLLNEDQLKNVKAAYTTPESDDYTILWPSDLTEFDVK